jgi:lysyl-tRNA synthetase class 1
MSMSRHEVPQGELPVTFGLLLNLVGVMGGCVEGPGVGLSRPIMWPMRDADKYPELDRLIDHALAYHRDFVAPTLKRRKPRA